MRYLDEIKDLKRQIAWSEAGSKHEFILKEKLKELEARAKFEKSPEQNAGQIKLF